ncbi:glucose-1-phosphate adenylyltransferase [Pradoshia sp. D12]|uniref:glucose-1-phosphate adenylyltransferase n=1 Tax=Bacillaceae TaxID=186817 RepID=UPI00080AFA29|nr:MULTISPECIES: glucose-1-phosphate adenylyltransferase [Bacillaceae]OCA81926.1 glucose-1-phosphate adenylyltransferase [Bacillus sp. FJAT-27986]QFK72602.1 glucose-1-phosphate adenylyltransferase [Pradoshia sp. D12]TPF70654.1 glucose-1-phosphate adenylyltransferase [Bacillus sp. D12]
MAKKKIVAMLLAGGQGTRLEALTADVAKPAVPFGGKYRIIDFTLSNCTNSGIDTVGVLTQYQPLLLNSYLSNGSAWDLDLKDGGVTVLPPYSASKEMRWYTGTASAVYQNLNYIDQYDPDYVIVLSGDHIYKMDYDKMLSFHEERGADATISVIPVPWDEASRFGIMNTREDYSVMEFEEKPKNPKNNLASMGIYIFNRKVLKDYLIKDAKNEDSTRDFGKDIIPLLLNDDKKVYAYPFEGYWKDVGTLKSYWEANMDLLDEECELNLYDYSWRIYSVNPNRPPQYLSNKAEVKESLINEGCIVEGKVEKSVVFYGAQIGKDAHVKDSVIMSDAVIGKNVYIEKAIIPPGAVIPDNQVIRPIDDEDVILVNPELLTEENVIKLS